MNRMNNRTPRLATLALMLAALTACTKTTISPNDDLTNALNPSSGAPIAFETKDAFSKAVIEDIYDLQQDGNKFLVWSWFQGTTAGPMFTDKGTEVKYGQTTGWTYEQTRYWLNGTYDFAAVYPSTASGEYKPAQTGGTPVLTVKDFDVTTQDDLLVAFNTGIDGSKGKANNPVNLNFKHAISNVQIRLSLKEEDFYEVLTDDNGNVIYDENNKPTLILDENQNPKQKGWVNVTKVEFRNISVVGTLATAEPTITFDNWTVDQPTGKVGFNLLSSPVEITNTPSDCLVNGGLLAIPQQVAALQPGDVFNGEVYLELSIDFPTIINEPIKRNITIPLQSGAARIPRWNPGKRYIYSGVVDQNFAIEFFVTTINNWDNDPLGGFIID